MKEFDSINDNSLMTTVDAVHMFTNQADLALMMSCRAIMTKLLKSDVLEQENVKMILDNMISELKTKGGEQSDEK